MRQRDTAAEQSGLFAEALLDQADVAIVVTGTSGELRYVNGAAIRLLRWPADVAPLLGRSLLSLGFAAGDRAKALDLAGDVLRGRTWEGTVDTTRGDRSQALVRVYAAPLRHPSGSVDGVIIVAREARGRSSLWERDSIGLLDRIGERLAGSLELDATLRHVADLLVPQLADHCFIDLFHGDRVIRRVAAHANGWRPPPGTWAGVGDEIRYPEGHFCHQAMTGLDTVVVPDVRDAGFPAPSAASLSAAEQAGVFSVVAAPLAARGELLGVLSLAMSNVTGRWQRRFGADDRDLLGAIASRVAIAIDNAMLFEAERQTALAFQKSLLPQALPVLDGLEVASRYVPAEPLRAHGQGIQTQVGGDWYDIIPLAAGRVGIVIGDVGGRGARAAAVMGQLRTALRAFAQEEQGPADILRKLDEWCRSMVPADWADGPLPGDQPIASCLYLVYDPWSRELSFADAGHDAPLLVVDGDATRLDIHHKGVLLGVRGKGIAAPPTYKEEALILPAGATLVLYTDGLTDRRPTVDGSPHTKDDAVAMLRTAIRAVAATGDADAIAAAAEHAVPGDIDDDMVILVVRTSPRDLPSVERVLPAEPVMVAQARQMAQETFETWGMDVGQRELACLLVSELVTNAVLHAAPPARQRRRFGVTADAAGPDGQAASPAGAAASTAGQATSTADQGAEVSSAPTLSSARSLPVPAMAAADPGPASTPAPERLLAAPLHAPLASGGTGGHRPVPVGSPAGEPMDAAPDAHVEPPVPLPADPTAGTQTNHVPGGGADSLGRSSGSFALRLRRGAAAVWVEVFDTDMRLPRIRVAGDTDEGGRGLYLVEQLATRWGSRPTRSGKAVWFEMPLSADGPLLRTLSGPCGMPTAAARGR